MKQGQAATTKWDNPATGRGQSFPFTYKFLARIGEGPATGFEIGGFTHQHAEKRLKEIVGQDTSLLFLRHGQFPAVQDIGHGGRMAGGR